eukprot:548626-Rhodomonas_salina.1
MANPSLRDLCFRLNNVYDEGATQIALALRSLRGLQVRRRRCMSWPRLYQRPLLRTPRLDNKPVSSHPGSRDAHRRPLTETMGPALLRPKPTPTRSTRSSNSLADSHRRLLLLCWLSGRSWTSQGVGSAREGARS